MRAKDVRAQVRSGFGDFGANYFRHLYGGLVLLLTLLYSGVPIV